jgi:hypothetical protein
MIDCIQFFLKEGLLEAKPLKLKVNKFIQKTSLEFHDFTLKGFVSTGLWIEKKDLLQEFKDTYPDLEEVSSNTLTRWVKKYAEENDLEYTDRKIGDKYEFKLNKKIASDDENGDENEY